MRLFILAAALMSAVPVHAAKPVRADVVDGAFRDMQMAIGSRAGLALSRSAARLASSDPALSRMIFDRQDANKRLAKAEAERMRVTALSTATPEEREKAANEASAARAAFDGIEAALAKHAPGYAQLTGIAPLSIKEAQALLAPDEAIVMMHSTDTNSYVFAVTATQTLWERSGLGRADAEALVQALRSSLDKGAAFAPGGSALRPDPYPRAKAFSLYQSVWQPIAPALKKVRTIYVVADGALGAMPFAALPTIKPAGRDEDASAMRRTKWLVRSHALVSMPSIGSLRALRAGATSSPSAQPFAGFGDPMLDGATDIPAPRSFAQLRSGVSGDLRSVIKSFPKLPGTRSELQNLARTLGAGDASLWLGDRATEDAVKAANLSNTSVIAFATHGLLAGEIGPVAEPALVLTPPATSDAANDGLLLASEAASLKMNADWIILSACNTAAPDGRASNEGLSGLARGFFSAGARALLVSHWRVRDDIVERLTVGTLARWKSGSSPNRAAALQAAMLAMIDDPAHPDLANPAYWAPFVVAGDGR